jgi:hypothetical protein
LEPGYIRIMAPNLLTREEFASLLKVGNCSTMDPPAAIPVEHSTKLIALGYMVDLVGRLRMTTPGRQRIAVGAGKVAAAPKLQSVVRRGPSGA